MRIIVGMTVVSLLASCGGTSVPIQVTNPTPLPSQNTNTTTADTPTTNVALLTGPDTAVPQTTFSSSLDDASFGSLLNNVRLSNGAQTVSHNAQLDIAAQLHAQDMLDNDYFSHTGLNGSSAGDRVTLAGYDWWTYGENIAAGYRTEDGVMKGWTESEGHHANNINPNFEEFGLGYAEGNGDTRWVLLLGAR